MLVLLRSKMKETSEIISYVKNVTAYYRQKLDAILKRRKKYIRASSGTVKLAFRPQLDKSFSRGFTDYFVHGRNPGIFSFDTPKSGKREKVSRERRV